MRTEAGKMPESLTFPIKNGLGASNDRFEINGKTVGLSELVKGVQDGLYDEEQLEKAITAFRIKDEDDSSRLEVSFDGQVMVLDENGGNTLTLTTISKPDSGVSLTTSSSSMSVVRGDGEDDVRIYVDGKEVSGQEFEAMSPDQFASIVVNKGDGTKYLSVTTVGKPDSEVSMTASSSSVSVAYGDGEDDNVRVFVDGKEVDKVALEKMSPEEISAVTVAKLEEGGKAIYVVTRRQEQEWEAKAGNEPRYFIDGEEVAPETVNDLDPAWIKSMRVDKDDETGGSLIHIALRPAGRKAMKAAKAGEGK